MIPKDVNIDSFFAFGGSDFQSANLEIVAQGIVLTARIINPREWTKFTYQQYEKVAFSHLGKFLLGDCPRISQLTIFVEKGYLLHDGDNYEVTESFRKVISKFVY